MQRKPGLLGQNPATAMHQSTANQNALPQQSQSPPSTTRSPCWTTVTLRPVTGPRTRMSPSATPMLTLMTSIPARPPTPRTPRTQPSPAQNHQQNNSSSPVTPQRKTSRRRPVLPAHRPMSSQLRGGRVARGGRVCSPSRRSTPTGRLREGPEREAAPCPSAVRTHTHAHARTHAHTHARTHTHTHTHRTYNSINPTPSTNRTVWRVTEAPRRTKEFSLVAIIF